MTRDCLNVILMDHDERNHILFKNIFNDHKFRIKVQVFFTGEELMGYLNNEKALIPEVLFLNHDHPEKKTLDLLDKIKSYYRFSDMTVVVCSGDFLPEEEDGIFVKGANVLMKIPEHYKDLKKSLTEIMTVNWQYHTSGFSKDNFIMKV